MHDYAPFINGSYGVSVIFLFGIGIATYLRYQRALKRLKAVETR
jgi:heme exporter protein CcmD